MATTSSKTAPGAQEAAETLLRQFRGKTITRTQTLDANQLQKLCLTLGHRHLPSLGSAVDLTKTTPPDGTPLPPGYHLVYFTPSDLEQDLGHDGTDRTFNAPEPFTRRMWAGGRMSWLPGSELRVGDTVQEHTTLLAATPKKSRDGSEMVLVEVEKKLCSQRGLAVVDQR